VSSPSGSASTGSSKSNVSAAGLPFTGYALLSVVVIGLCLLSIGLVVRRRVQSLRR